MNLTTQPATDAAGNSGKSALRKCRKTNATEQKRIKTTKKYCKKLHFAVDVQGVTGSSPVSSTTKTAVFYIKQRFFLTF